jgi:hypothetical protein
LHLSTFFFVTFADMYILLISILIALFVAMLFVNLYFRAKVLKTYGVLVKNRVEFKAEHLFNRRKLEEEILPKYPQQRTAILDFVNHMRRTIRMASLLIVLITAIGAVLMWFRNY